MKELKLYTGKRANLNRGYCIYYFIGPSNALC